MNARDFVQVEELLADDFCIIDNTGRTLRGRDDCLALFIRVAELIPDYRLIPSAIVQRGKDILISGKSQTIDPGMGRTTQWRARANPSQMLEWQSYAHGQTISLIAEVQKAQP